MKILIVEDDKVYANALKQFLEKELFFVQCDVCYTYKDALNVINSSSYDIFVLDYILPDTKDGELVDKVLELDKTVIVITNFLDKLTRDQVFSKKVADYIIKSDFSNLDYIKNSIERLNNNKNLTILVVDDSALIRKYITSILDQQNLNILEANDGQEALKVFENHNIDLLITDYEMPNVNGLELVKKVRKTHKMHDLPIIVLSTISENTTISRLLKSGANDFIHKPFTKDEFLCRLNININMYETLKSMKKEIVTDSLTKLYNRHFLEYRGNKIFKDSESIVIALFDIDNFKTINDTYGHAFGDKVLEESASVLKLSLRQDDYIVRYGGEEFLVVFQNISKKLAFLLAEKVRKNIGKIDINGITFTISGGVSDKGETLSEMIKDADKLLYKAKENGKNRIEIDI